MTHRHEPVTRGTLRWHLFVAVLVGVALIGLRSYNAEQNNVDAQRAACERGNSLREAAYNNAVRDARSRQAAADQFTGHARRVIERQAEAGWKDAQALVTASADVAAEPGSVVQDCEVAYPYPGLFG